MRLGDTFPLGSYLIKPFQRMTRYRLFLQDMIKHSTKTDTKGKLKEYYDKLKVCVCVCVCVCVRAYMHCISLSLSLCVCVCVCVCV